MQHFSPNFICLRLPDDFVRETISARERTRWNYPKWRKAAVREIQHMPAGERAWSF